jgi:hypothetical protein
VRAFEYPLVDQAPSPVAFDYYWNSFWCIILTQTTVGYGEIYPITALGRLTTIFACLWGMFNMSMIIVTLTNIISLSSEEEKAFAEIEGSKTELKNLSDDAASFIQKYGLYYLAKRKNLDERKTLKCRTDYMTVQHRFQFKRNQIKFANPDIGDAIDELTNTVFNTLRDGSKRIKLLKDDVTKQVCEMR